MCGDAPPACLPRTGAISDTTISPTVSPISTTLPHLVKHAHAVQRCPTDLAARVYGGAARLAPFPAGRRPSWRRKLLLLLLLVPLMCCLGCHLGLSGLGWGRGQPVCHATAPGVCVLLEGLLRTGRRPSAALRGHDK